MVNHSLRAKQEERRTDHLEVIEGAEPPKNITAKPNYPRCQSSRPLLFLKIRNERTGHRKCETGIGRAQARAISQVCREGCRERAPENVHTNRHPPRRADSAWITRVRMQEQRQSAPVERIIRDPCARVPVHAEVRLLLECLLRAICTDRHWQ